MAIFYLGKNTFIKIHIHSSVGNKKNILSFHMVFEGFETSAKGIFQIIWWFYCFIIKTNSIDAQLKQHFQNARCGL